MDEPKRERIRELIQALESAQERVRALLIEEEVAFEERSLASKETASGKISEEAARCLSEAEGSIQDAIDHMQSAIGDASLLPEPTPAPMKRRRF